jgi:hypothetical protein
VKAIMSVFENRCSPMSCRNHLRGRARQQRLVHRSGHIEVLLAVKGVS